MKKIVLFCVLALTFSLVSFANTTAPVANTVASHNQAVNAQTAAPAVKAAAPALAANPKLQAAQQVSATSSDVVVKAKAINPAVARQGGVSVEKVVSKKGKAYNRCRGANGKFVKCPK